MKMKKYFRQLTQRHRVASFRLAMAGCLVNFLTLLVPNAWALEGDVSPVPREEGWLVKTYSEAEVPVTVKSDRADKEELKAIASKRSTNDIARFQWWATGGPGYRWNEIILAELAEDFVTLPLAARHLALFQAAVDDAVAVALRNSSRNSRQGKTELDSAIKATSSPSSPSAHAAAAAAASEVLSYLFPTRSSKFSALAEEAIQVRLRGGAEFPQEVAAGRLIGHKVASFAIARGKADRSDHKWTGTIPEGPGAWKGSNPVAPAAATWQTWVLTHPGEFRPAAPPAFDSDVVKSALAELKAFPRTPRTNHRALYWEVHGGARAHTLWNEIARVKLLEYNASPRVSSRVLAALNIAFADAGIACWDAKYSFWYVRPPQLDADLKPLFPPPNHPSYPAAHGCLSTAAATVLASVFPRDREQLLAMGKEAAEARIWAGIHYRFDIDAGQEIGRKVAQRTLERAFKTPTN